LGLFLAAPAARAASHVATAADFEAAIARLEQPDPGAPQALNARLQYADFLVNGTGDCHTRLDEAARQLDAVAAHPGTRILFALAPARLDGAAYALHAARADCDPSARESELRKALDAARAAAHGYRAGWDYPAAAVMQFNVAATLRALGDNQAAITALQSAIAMDRIFGFRDDAADNLALLQRWQGGDDSDSHIAELMKDFPAPRTAALNFAWGQSDADTHIAANETSLVAGQVVESLGAVTVARHVRPDGKYWLVSHDPGSASADLGTWPPGHDIMKRFAAYMLALAMLETPKFRVESNGDFYELREGAAFAKALSAEMTARFGTAPPEQKALTQDLRSALVPGQIETRMAEMHSLETATWAGARLEQGKWYQMKAPLFLPGMGLGQYFLVTHTIEFSYTRDVACAPGDAAASCAEIVVRAAPTPDDLSKVMIQMASLFHMKDFDSLRYWSAIDLRLIVKPSTLAPVLSDMRRSWYVNVLGDSTMEPVVSSERIVTTLAYH